MKTGYQALLQLPYCEQINLLPLDHENYSTQYNLIIIWNRAYLPLPGYDKQGRAVILMRGGAVKAGVVKMEQTCKVSRNILGEDN